MTCTEQSIYGWLRTQDAQPHELENLPEIYRRMKRETQIPGDYRDFRRAAAYAVLTDLYSTDEQIRAEAEILRRVYGDKDPVA